jgi:hypothetical protein
MLLAPTEKMTQSNGTQQEKKKRHDKIHVRSPVLVHRLIFFFIFFTIFIKSFFLVFFPLKHSRLRDDSLLSQETYFYFFNHVCEGLG